MKRTIDLVQELVQKPENRKVALLHVDNWIYVYEDDIVVEDMIHNGEHVVAIVKRNILDNNRVENVQDS